MPKTSHPVVIDGVSFFAAEDVAAYLRSKAEAKWAAEPPDLYEISEETRRAVEQVIDRWGGATPPPPREPSARRKRRPPRQISSADTLKVNGVAAAVGSALGGLDVYSPGRRIMPSPEQKRRLARYIGKQLNTHTLERRAAAGDRDAQEALPFRVTHLDVLQEMGLTEQAILDLGRKLREVGLLKVRRFDVKGRPATFGETLVHATFTDASGAVVEGSSFSSQRDPKMIAEARAIAESYGLAAALRPNPLSRRHR